MTFGTLALWQGLLLGGGAALAATLLFFVKVRPPRVVVSSLLIWRRVLDHPRERTLWERIRRAVSLAMTILIALALALAALRLGPAASRSGGAAGDRVHLVLDTSWSMLARTNRGDTRWDRAAARARHLAAAAGGPVSLATTSNGIVVGPTADRGVIAAAIELLSPSGGDGAPWQSAGAGPVHFVTDGATPRSLPRDVVVHSVFEPASNVGITAFDVRPSLAGRHAADAYLEIANFSPAGQQVRVSVVRGEGSLLDRQVHMAAGERLRQIFPVPAGEEDVLSARVTADANALDVDDRADAWIARAGVLHVALVGDDLAWLTPLFDGDPRVRLSLLRAADYPRGAERADVFIFDRWAPADPPPAPSLYFAPPSRRGAEEARPRWESAGTHPVVRGVDPFTLGITRARSYAAPELAPVARSARGTPLVYVAEGPEHRRVVVTFGPDESNLTAVPAFPVLVGNAIDWLAGPIAAGVRQPGTATFAARIERIEAPGGRELPIARLGDVSSVLLPSPGLHHVAAGSARGMVAVNIADPGVSDLTRTTLQPGGTADIHSRSTTPWWIYLALAAFALALLEWWTWVRRITV